VPSDQAVAVLIGGEAGNWLPIGWWSGSGWVEAGGEGATEVPAAPGDQVAIVQLAGTGAAELGALDEACQDGRNGFAVPAAGVPAPEPPGFGYSAVALNAAWNVQPRPAVEAGAAVDEYERIGEQLAAGLGVDPVPGDVAQVVRVDLDGDGIEEVVVAFEYVQESLIGAVGDVSVIYARLPEADGTVRDQVLLSAAVTPDMQDFPVSDRFRVLGAADVNGDGVMELLVRSWYYEGAGVTAFELRGGELVEVLAGGCGS
jgi:hypothetical protein